MSLREDVAQIASLLGLDVVTLPQAIEEANLMMGIAGEGTLPMQVQVLLEACNSTTEIVKAELDDDEAVVPSAGRDFSGRGDWSAHATNADDDLEMLPNMQVASSFLEKNSQAHTSAMTALGDIVDNARESGATKLSIDVVDGPDSERGGGGGGRRGAANNRVLKVSDNGAGMGEGRVLEGMMSIGFTRKDFSTGKHYGFGAKTAIPRVAEYALIFTREAGSRHRVLGLLSSAFSESAGAKQTKLPLCSWLAEGGPEAILTEAKTEAAPLDRESRAASLRWILASDGCPFADAATLLDEFAAFDVGTRLVMWGIKKDIHLKKQARDVIVDAPADAPTHRRSLHAFLEILYLKLGEEHTPSMQIVLKRRPVPPRDWAEHLQDQRQEYLLPPPNSKDVTAQFVGEGAARLGKQAARQARATLTLGYSRSMREIVQILSARAGADPVIRERKAAVKKETGVFFYHQGRMTRPLEPLLLQAKKQGAQQTTTMRVLQMGMGLTGCVVENFLIQDHNKASYSDGKLFEALMKEADKVAKLHLATVVRPAFGEAKGLLPQPMAPTKPQASMSTATPLLPPGEKKPKPPKAVELVEETRMRPRDRLDEAVGLVVRVPGIPGAARYQLRTPDFALSERSYLAHELTESYFNPSFDLAAGMSAAPAALAGCTVEVWWLPADAEATGQFWPATLQPPPEEWRPRTGGREGWFSMVYPVTELDFGERAPVEPPALDATPTRSLDPSPGLSLIFTLILSLSLAFTSPGGDELVFVALPSAVVPSASSMRAAAVAAVAAAAAAVAVARGTGYSAFREDGEEMPGGTEFKIPPSALRALLQPPAAAEAGEVMCEEVQVGAIEVGRGGTAGPGVPVRAAAAAGVPVRAVAAARGGAVPSAAPSQAPRPPKRPLEEPQRECSACPDLQALVLGVMREAAALEPTDLVAVTGFKARAAAYLRAVEPPPQPPPQQQQRNY